MRVCLPVLRTRPDLPGIVNDSTTPTTTSRPTITSTHVSPRSFRGKITLPVSLRLTPSANPNNPPLSPPRPHPPLAT